MLHQQSGEFPLHPIESSKAQSSLEFLVFVTISILFLLAAVIFFGARSEEVAEMKKISEMEGICNSVSSRISAVFASGDGTNSSLDLQEAVLGKNISVWVYGSNGSVTVRDDETDVGCPLSAQSVSNGSSSSFEVAKNATLRNSKGVVLVG